MAQQPEVIVVGGGVIGLATAYFLSVEGVKVEVLEREGIGSQASGTAAGFLSSIWGVGGPGPLLALTTEGLRQHRSLAPALREETGVEVQYAELSVLRPAFSQEEAQQLRSELSWQQEAGFKMRWVEGEEARRLEPRLSPQALGAVFSQNNEAQLDSYRLVLALARGAEMRGAVIRHGQVVGLTRQGRKVTGVVLPGERVSCDRVVLAMGPWTGQASQWLGFPVPVEPLRGQLLRLRLPDPPLRWALFWKGGYVLRKPDGLVTAGTTEEKVGFDNRTTEEGRASIMESLLTLGPSLAEAELVEFTACLRPLSGDGLPILGQVPGWEGLYLATGHGRKGILLSAVTGRIMADLLVRGRSSLPVEAFAPARFAAQGPQ